MTYILSFVLFIFQIFESPEEAALSHFEQYFYLSPTLFQNQCADDDPDCIYLGTVIDKEFLGTSFLEGYQLHVNRYVVKPDDNIPFILINEQFYTPDINNRMKRIRDAAFERPQDTLRVRYPLETNTTLNVPKSFITSNYDVYSELLKRDRLLYVEVSEAIYTGEEYFVTIDFYQNFNHYFDYDKSFRFAFILNKDLEVVYWQESG